LDTFILLLFLAVDRTLDDRVVVEKREIGDPAGSVTLREFEIGNVLVDKGSCKLFDGREEGIKDKGFEVFAAGAKVTVKVTLSEDEAHAWDHKEVALWIEEGGGNGFDGSIVADQTDCKADHLADLMEDEGLTLDAHLDVFDAPVNKGIGAGKVDDVAAHGSIITLTSGGVVVKVMGATIHGED